jgi:hypothetical protein
LVTVPWEAAQLTVAVVAVTLLATGVPGALGGVHTLCIEVAESSRESLAVS